MGGGPIFEDRLHFGLAFLPERNDGGTEQERRVGIEIYRPPRGGRWGRIGLAAKILASTLAAEMHAFSGGRGGAWIPSCSLVLHISPKTICMARASLGFPISERCSLIDDCLSRI